MIIGCLLDGKNVSEKATVTNFLYNISTFVGRKFLAFWAVR